MKRFLYTSFVFVGFQLPIIVLILLGWSKTPEPYLAAMVDKHQLANSIPHKRMLLVGGSNLAFGIDSATLQREFGYHPINLGLCAGLGLEFMLNQCRDLMKRDDIVILSLEYTHFWQNQAGPVHTVPVLEHFPHGQHYIEDAKTWKRIENYKNRQKDQTQGDSTDTGLLWLHRGVRRSLQSYTRRPRREIYVRDGFNEYGDLTTHHGQQGKLDIEAACRERYVVREGYWRIAIEQINEFARDCRRRGVKVYLIHTPIPRTYWKHRKADILRVVDGMEKQLTVPLLTKFEASMYPDDLFFDQVYHVTEDGKHKRTRQICEGLRRLGL